MPASGSLLPNLSTYQHEQPVRLQVGGERLSAVLHLPREEAECGLSARPMHGWPSLLMLHGFTANKTGDHRLFTRFARLMAARGMAVLRADFRGHGDSDGDFAAVTLERQLEDVNAAAAYLRERSDTDPLRLTLLGHSLGGMITALSAEQVEASRLLLWSPALPDYFLQFLQGGRLPATVIDHVGWPLSPAYLQELTRAAPLKAAGRWGGEALAIHGEADDECPPAWSERYAEALGAGTQVALVDGASHTFDSLEHTDTLYQLSADFLLGRVLD